MSRYTIAPEAISDLDELSNYFLRDVEAGERWFEAFNQKCLQLVQLSFYGEKLCSYSV